MHVAINAQLLSFAPSYRSGGISRYIYHLLKELARLESAHTITAVVPDLPPDQAHWQRAGLRLRRSLWPTRRPVMRILWEQFAQPLALKRANVDVVHATGYVAPLLWRGPSVVTVYDLSFLRYPEVFNRANRLYLRLFTRLSVARARHVITISAHTRRDVIDLLGVPPERVSTTYCGVDETFQVLPAQEVKAYKARRGLPDAYILYLGTLEPRKNVVALLRAFARLKAERAVPHKLVLAGAPGWQYQAIFETVAALHLEQHVQFLGFVPSEEQVLCYNGADLFVYPSLYEGFGLPVLEAMACGVPVITSDAASLPEVVGDAGLQVQPHDEQALADAMGRVLEDAALRESFRSAGLTRAKRFSWSTMAVQTMRIYEQAGAAPPSPTR